MAASIASQHQSFLSTYFDLAERAEQANNLQLAVNQLRVENQDLRARLAEEETKNAEEIVVLNARIEYLRGLREPANTSRRIDDALGTGVTTVSPLVPISYLTVRGRSS